MESGVKTKLTVDDVVRSGACRSGVTEFHQLHFPTMTVVGVTEALEKAGSNDKEYILTAAGMTSLGSLGYGDVLGCALGDGYGYGYGYGDGDGYGYGYGDGYGNSDGECYGCGYGDGYGDCYGNGDGDGDSNSDSDGDGYSDSYGEY